MGERPQKVVIAVSTGRTGSQALAHHFDACFPQVRALHEPKPSRGLRIASNRYLCGRSSRGYLARRLASARADLLAAAGTPIYLESNPFLHGFLEVFDAVFGEPQVLHIVRDPRSYIPSYINFGAFRGLKGWAARAVPFWMLKPDQFERDPHRRWREMGPAERVAWRWNAVNGVLDRGQALFGPRYLRLRYEDLFDPGGEALSELLRRLGLPPSDDLSERFRKQRVNASPDRGFPPFDQWEEALRERILDTCRERMARYGYEV